MITLMTDLHTVRNRSANSSFKLTKSHPLSAWVLTRKCKKVQVTDRSLSPKPEGCLKQPNPWGGNGAELTGGVNRQHQDTARRTDTARAGQGEKRERGSGKEGHFEGEERCDLRQQGQSKGWESVPFRRKIKKRKSTPEIVNDEFCGGGLTSSCFQSTWHNCSLMRVTVSISSQLARTQIFRSEAMGTALDLHKQRGMKVTMRTGAGTDGQKRPDTEKLLGWAQQRQVQRSWRVSKQGTNMCIEAAVNRRGNTPGHCTQSRTGRTVPRERKQGSERGKTFHY